MIFVQDVLITLLFESQYQGLYFFSLGRITLIAASSPCQARAVNAWSLEELLYYLLNFHSIFACALFCVRVEEIICEVKFSAISFYFLSKVGCAVITEAKFVK